MQAEYGDLYTEANVAMSGTHTHSGPGGYLQYILYIITSLGFVRESFDVLVGGILEVRAAKLCMIGFPHSLLRMPSCAWHCFPGAHVHDAYTGMRALFV